MWDGTLLGGGSCHRGVRVPRDPGRAAPTPVRLGADGSQLRPRAWSVILRCSILGRLGSRPSCGVPAGDPSFATFEVLEQSGRAGRGDRRDRRACRRAARPRWLGLRRPRALPERQPARQGQPRPGRRGADRLGRGDHPHRRRAGRHQDGDHRRSLQAAAGRHRGDRPSGVALGGGQPLRRPAPARRRPGRDPRRRGHPTRSTRRRPSTSTSSSTPSIPRPATRCAASSAGRPPPTAAAVPRPTRAGMYLNPSLAASSRLFSELNRDTPLLRDFVVSSSRLVTHDRLPPRRPGRARRPPGDHDRRDRAREGVAGRRGPAVPGVHAAGELDVRQPALRRSTTSTAWSTDSKPVAKKLRPFVRALKPLADQRPPDAARPLGADPALGRAPTTSSS